MSRIFFWRLLCLLTLAGSVLQIVGFFLPYSVIVNTAKHTTIEADSYWSPFTQLTSGNGSSPIAIFISLFALFAILFLMLIAGIELMERPRSHSWARIWGFVLALLTLLGFLFWSVVSTAMAGFCMADDPRNCVLTGEFGSGFWPSLTGYLISTICFLMLLILGSIWWRPVPHWQPSQTQRWRPVEQ